MLSLAGYAFAMDPARFALLSHHIRVTTSPRVRSCGCTRARRCSRQAAPHDSLLNSQLGCRRSSLRYAGLDYAELESAGDDEGDDEGPGGPSPKGQCALSDTAFEYIRPQSRSGLLTLSEVGKIADSLKNGSLAVLPTETGHMLAALATSTKAVELAFAVKGRMAANVMHVACASLQMADRVGRINQLAIRLLGELTPGPVTVIVDKTSLLPDRLVTLNGTVGIRIPAHPATLQVINAVGTPLTATSLNSSGSAPEPLDKFDVQLLNWPKGRAVYIVEDDDAIAYRTPSTLVRVTSGSVEVLRPGPIPEPEIRRIASLPNYLEVADAT